MVTSKTGFPNGVDYGGNAVVDQSHSPGLAAFGTLRWSGAAVAGETVTIGNDVYRFAVVGTASGKTTANGELNNTDAFVPQVTMAAHGLKSGDAIMVGTEAMQVATVLDVNRFSVIRGISGTTIAAHADGVAINTEASPGAGSIAVVTSATLTAAVMIPALVADINDGRRSSANVAAEATGTTAIHVYSALRDPRNGAQTITGGLVNAAAIATTETMTNGAWDAATLGGGVNPGVEMTLAIVPTAAEVTAGLIKRTFPFVPTVVLVRVFTTATQAAVAWNGAATVSGNTLTIDNAGATDWSVNETLHVIVRG